MFVNVETGKHKKPVAGQCLICNAKEPTKHSTLGVSFCELCWEAMQDEEELAKRIVWDG